MFLIYNLTEFLRALAYCLSKAFALCGSSFFPLRKLELAFNPTELIGELQFTNCESLLHDDMTEPHSLDFLRTYLFFVVSSYLPSPMRRGHCRLNGVGFPALDLSKLPLSHAIITRCDRRLLCPR